MQQHHVVQVLLQSFGGGQAKHAHTGPHTDTNVQSYEHTDYNHGPGYKYHISKFEMETHKKT